MESIKAFLFHNWQRKLLALLSAMVIWFFVASSITESKSIPNVPIRIINLPPDKTIVGLLPNRLLSKRVTLTLSGSKDVIEELEPGDLEVLLDVSTADSDEWVVKIGKKNLVSLNPSIDLSHNITQVSHNEFVLKLSPIVTAKIPIKVLNPSGETPAGYEFLDVWPQKLMQTVSGAEEEIQILKNKGLTLSFNLNEISKADLDAIKSVHGNVNSDEISYVVPLKWLKIALPWQTAPIEEINDPEAKNLQIEFLRKSLIPVEKEIQVGIFYPLKNSETINPTTYPLAIQNPIITKNNVPRLSTSLFAKDVSNLFFEIVSDYLQIVIIAAPKTERDQLAWNLIVTDPHELEDIYVAYMISNTKNVGNKKREQMLRKRFRDYLYKLELYSDEEHKLRLESTLREKDIQVHIFK